MSAVDIIALLAGLASGYGMVKSANGNHGVQGKGRRQKRRGPISSGAGGMNPTNKSDLLVKPPSFLNVPKSIPRNIQGQVVWDTVKINFSITSTGGLVETGFVASLAQHPQASTWAALFDQWSVPQFSVEFDSLLPPGSTTAPLTLYTALDFDSIGNVGSVAAIEDFSTCEVTAMQPQSRVVRSVRPSNKESVQLTNSTAALAAANGPIWMDSAAPLGQFLGIRSLLTGTAGAIQVIQTNYYCFRNQI